MNTMRGSKRKALLLSVFFLIGIIIYPLFRIPMTEAQNWTALPPYNTLWPLWSPALSPVDSATGLPAPLVTSITSRTVLPVQPGLTWHPSMRNPWLLYNTPLGLAYYDPIGGIDLWPPPILTNVITGLPINITLPAGYSSLLPTPAWWLFNNVAAANWSYLVAYPSYSAAAPSTATLLPQPSITSLLTATALLL
ncbi:MAG: hypothetical protein AB1611_05875 [bacterium]